jgi:hypothetical protein
MHVSAGMIYSFWMSVFGLNFPIIMVQIYLLGWTVRGSNLSGGEIFRSRPDQPWGPPSLLYNGYRVIPGGKAAEAWS